MATYLGFPVAASAASTTGVQGLIPKESWSARMAGRLVPGASGMSAGDRDAMMRQGLLGLAAGMASTGGQGIAGALGNGLQSGLLAMNQGRDSITDAAYKRSIIENQAGDPAGFRTMDMQARAAGYEPGTDGYKEFFRRANGEIGRASSGGIGFDTFTDSSGVPRPQRNNPRTGTVELWYDEQGQWVPLGGGEVAQGAQPTTPTTTAMGMPIAIGNDIDPAMRQLIEQFEAQQRPMPANVQLPERQVPSFTPAPLAPRGLGRGITKADEAAQIEAAKLGVQAGMVPGIAGATTAAQEAARLSYLQEELDARTRAAIEEATGKGAVTRADTAAATAAKNAVAMQTYQTGIEGLRSGLAGTSTGYVQGMLPAVTTGQQIAEGGVSAIAPILKSIFREAGEGTFTDRDQETLMAMVPTRRDNPAAREAKLANIDAIVQAKLGASMPPQPPAAAQSAQGGQQATGAPSHIQSRSDYDALPSGASYIAPDGSRRRKP